MSQEGGTQNKRFDRALPFTARPTVYTGIQSLISYTRQQLRHLGESNSRLAKWVIDRAGLASSISRNIHLPLLLRDFDSIWRKPTIVPPVWQRMLNLPWVQQHQEKRRNPYQTAYAATDLPQTNDTRLRVNGLYPSRLLQTSPDTEEQTLVDEMDEAYPAVTKNVLSPPAVGERLPITSHELPQHDVVTAMPLGTKQIADRLYPNKLIQTLADAGKEQPDRTAGEAYPAVIKNVLSPPAVGDRLPVTSYKPFHDTHTGLMSLMTRQRAVDLQTEDIDNFTLSHVSQSRIPIPGTYQPNNAQKIDRMQIKGADEGLTRPLSRVLTPITQRVALNRRLMGTRPHITSEGISEGHDPPIRSSYLTEGESISTTAKQAAMPFITSMPKVESPDDSTVNTYHTSHTLIGSNRLPILERKVLPDTMPSSSGPIITEEASKIPSQPALQRTANKINELRATSLPVKEVTSGEGYGMLLRRITPQRVLQVSQNQTGESVVSRQTNRVQQEAQEAEVTHIPEDASSLTLSPDIPNLITPEGSSIGQGFTEGYAKKPLFYREAPSIAGSTNRPLPIIENTSRAITLPSLQRAVAYVPLSDKSEIHGSLQNHEYSPSLHDYKHTRQPVLELPVASWARPEAEFSAASGGELFRQVSGNTSGLTYSRNNGTSKVTPELKLAPIARAGTNEPPKAAEPEAGGEVSREQEAAPDLRALARDIYPLIKRMIMVERERRPI